MLLVRSYQWFPNAVIIKFKLFSKLYKALHEPIMPHSLTLFIMTFFMILKYNKCIWMSDIVLVFSPIGNSWLAPWQPRSQLKCQFLRETFFDILNKVVSTLLHMHTYIFYLINLSEFFQSTYYYLKFYQSFIYYLPSPL